MRWLRAPACPEAAGRPESREPCTGSTCTEQGKWLEQMVSRGTGGWEGKLCLWQLLSGQLQAGPAWLSPKSLGLGGSRDVSAGVWLSSCPCRELHGEARLQHSAHTHSSLHGELQGGLRRDTAQGWRAKGDRQGVAHQRDSPTGTASRAKRVCAPHAAALLHAAAPRARSSLPLPHCLTCTLGSPLRSTITSARICHRRSHRGPAAGSGSSATGTP